MINLPQDTRRQDLRSPLSAMQAAFSEFYSITLHGKESAIKAGYSVKVAQETAVQVLRNENVQKYIAYLREQQLANMGVSQQRVLEELARLAYADPLEMYDEDGCIRKISEIPEDLRRAITKIETKEIFEQDGRRKKYVGDAKTVILGAKEKALEMIGRHVGLFEKDNKQKRDITIIVTADESAKIWTTLQSEY